MFRQQKDWETRENAFAAFTMGPLTDFWHQREEAEFTGVDDVPVRFVRFAPKITIGSWSSVRGVLKAT
jgi:lysophospholipase